MCGIWASVGLVPPATVIDNVAHRGPDGRGWQEFETSAGRVVLAHRRLAIIDTSDAAAQPMAWQGRWWITYNGEIYNYVELKAELQQLGYVFSTSSDTEVLLAAYQQWGSACLDRLVGMFAFVIYDRNAEQLFIARDRFGIKPLYLWQRGAALAFASEIKQFTTAPGFAAQANTARCQDFLEGGLFDHTGQTLFAGVGQLRGGECVLIQLADWQTQRRLQTRRWYQLPEANTLTLDAEEAASRFRALLAESVRIHLRADVMVGSCLSGGLDSSSIVCLALDELTQRQAHNVFHTVSSCFEDAAVDERPFIAAMVDQTGVLNSQVFPRAETVFEQAEAITRHQDEPFGSTSVVAQWCVFERARREGIKVMLDGQGADEQLAGYHGMFPLYYSQLLRRGQLLRLLTTIMERKRLHGTSLHGEFRALIRILMSSARSVYRGWRPTSGQVPSVIEAALARDGLGPWDGLGHACRAQLQTTNLPMLLHYEDRNSMAHSVEARVPFLDHRLVELCVRLGDAHKMNGAETKTILRRGLKDVLPREIHARRDKLGFATPEERWLKGPLRSFVMEGVDDAVRRFPHLLHAGDVGDMARRMLDGSEVFDFRLWRVASLGMWGRIFSVAA